MVKANVMLRLLFFTSADFWMPTGRAHLQPKPRHSGRRGGRGVAVRSQLGTGRQRAEVRTDANPGEKLLRV